jgi:tRNA dimethylallyltransferase
MTYSKKLICILGPTAVGKTTTAIALAKHLGTEIISADSRQFYKEISIGTAKPSPTELAEIPHHFIGHLSITESYSAGNFERDAIAKISNLFETHDTVVAVGGSGLYVKALVEGLDDMPPANEELRIQLAKEFAANGLVYLQQQLHQLDATVYAQTEIQNPQRVMRAIEVVLAKQQGFIPAFNKQPRTFKTINVVLNLPREILYERINQRVISMMQQGLVDEVKNVLHYKENYALQTVGYKELFEYFEGKHSLNKAIELIQQHTRNFAKRQLTWFKKEVPTHWITPSDIDVILKIVSSTS